MNAKLPRGVVILSVFLYSYIATESFGQTHSLAEQTNQEVRLSVAAAKSACRIFIGAESGTCFFVSRIRKGKQQTILVTAAHLFEKATGNTAKLVFRSNSGRSELTIPFQNASHHPLWKKHSKYDIAALPVGLPASDMVNLFLMEQLARKEHFASQAIFVGQACRIPCFPAKLESSSLGYPILRSGSIASYPLTPVIEQPTFMVDISAFGGDSGAPVLAAIVNREKQSQSKPQPKTTSVKNPVPEQTLMVLGLVFAKQRQTDKTITPYEERIRHTPMGISIAVNSVFIRETIELIP